MVENKVFFSLRRWNSVCLAAGMIAASAAGFSQEDAETAAQRYAADILSIEVEIPAARRPNQPDKEKVAAARLRDADGSSFEETEGAIRYGTPSEINAVIDEITESGDPRYVDALYDLFQASDSNDIKCKVLDYFAHLKDGCLSDYAVTVLDDPYDEPNSVVEKAFSYVAAVECHEAAPALVKLLESGEETYFSGALSALGKTGGGAEAVYLSEYIRRDDLTAPQRQALMRTLGEMCAVDTWERLSEIAQDGNENVFVRMYAAEAIGKMKLEESVPILIKLYGEGDPNLRQYCVKGLSYFPGSAEAVNAVLQAIRDDHYKVRIEAVKAAGALKLTDAVDFLTYRAKKDPEAAVKKECYPVIAELNTAAGNEFLTGLLSDKKSSDTVKAQAAEALLQSGHAGEAEVAALAREALQDDRRMQLRHTLGKLLIKYGGPAYAEVCAGYVQSKDVTTVSQGLEMYRNSRYESAKPSVASVAEEKKASANRSKARKLLGMDEEDVEPPAAGQGPIPASDAK
ncbi:MAG: HEAT repeat domain-containing protein [Treponemataceae bacterium]|nr:HEAT repeat domain-containing protein [Treponemataceae bacterium]